MVTRQLSLTENIYSSQLRAELWKLQADTSYDSMFIRLLLDILQIDLLTITSETLKERYSPELLKEIIELDIQAVTSNAELIARVLDVKMLNERAHIKSAMKPAVANYIQLFDLTESYSYLIRALALVRIGRQLFTQEMPELLEKSTKVAIDLPYPYWQNRLVTQLALTFEKTVIQEVLERVIEVKLQELTVTQDVTGAQLCIDSLNVIGSINDGDASKRKAMLFEQEADRIIAEREPNTFYPTISQKLTAALNLIKDLPECQELKKRIIDKLQSAQLDDIRMVSLAGAKISPDIDVQKILSMIAAMDIKSSSEAVQRLLSLPIPSVELISEQRDKRDPSFLDQAFSKHVKLSSQGRPVGSRDGEEAKDNQTRMFLREYLILLIKMLKDIMDIYGTPSNQQVFELLVELKSPFVSPERTSLYAMGIGAGFSGNFIEAAHLLIPQLEHSFRHLATTQGISVTNFGNTQEQLENTMGGTLQKMVTIVDGDLFVELQNFLLDGSSVNFRNELMHGIINPKLAEHYGYYLWWLSLKMIYQTKILFRLKE